MNIWQCLSYNFRIAEGLLDNFRPVGMVAIILNNKNDKNAIIREMNDAGYFSVNLTITLGFENNGLYPLFFTPVEEEPVNNFMYKNICNGDYTYLYYIAPKDCREWF